MAPSLHRSSVPNTEGHGEIICELAKDGKIILALKGEYGDVLRDASGDTGNASIDNAGMEAYDKIKLVPQGR